MSTFRHSRITAETPPSNWYRSLLAALLLIGILSGPTATAASKRESAFGLGMNFYSGVPGSDLTPGIAGHLSFSSAVLFAKLLNWVHYFDLNVLAAGTKLGSQTLNYKGIAGIYTPALRINFSKTGMVPYLQAGPNLGIFALLTDGNSATASRSQTALKYGYTVGTGFDLLNADRGSGGWGISVDYFQFFQSPSSFEFSAGSVAAKGVKFNLHLLFTNPK